MTPPAMHDNAQFLLFQPWKTSLYNSSEQVRYWLRVVSDGSFRKKVFTKTLSGSMNGSSGSPITDVVTTSDLSSYCLAVSYGSTPHIETGIIQFDNLNGLVPIYSEPMALMTQSMLRNYEARLDTLVKIAQDKDGCVFHDEQLCRSLVCEMKAVIVLWAQLMNTGYISPVGCTDDISFTGDIHAELPKIIEDRRQLKARLLYSNFHDMPYKIESYQRESLLSLH